VFEFVLMVVVVASERYRERLQLSSERPFSSSSHERAALHRRSSFVTPSLAHLAPPRPRCLACRSFPPLSLPLLCRRASEFSLVVHLSCSSYPRCVPRLRATASVDHHYPPPLVSLSPVCCPLVSAQRQPASFLIRFVLFDRVSSVQASHRQQPPRSLPLARPIKSTAAHRPPSSSTILP